MVPFEEHKPKPFELLHETKSLHILNSLIEVISFVLGENSDKDFNCFFQFPDFIHIAFNVMKINFSLINIRLFFSNSLLCTLHLFPWSRFRVVIFIRIRSKLSHPVFGLTQDDFYFHGHQLLQKDEITEIWNFTEFLLSNGFFAPSWFLNGPS